MPRERLLICLICILATACAPATSELASQQAGDSTEAATPAHDEEEDHAEDEHHEEEHSDEHDHDHEHSDDQDHDHEHEDEDEQRELGAHEHGAAELTVAMSGNEVAIDLQTPAFNVLGFEYAPTSDAEKALLNDSIALLEAGSLIQMNSDAECTLTSATVQADIAEGEHAEEAHDEEAHDEEIHSDIDVSYILECQQPDRIESLDAGELFVQFPNFEEIAVQWISDTQQSAADLTPEEPVLMFK